MKQNKKMTSIAIFAVLAIGIGAVASTSFQEEKLGTQTDPSEFTNENYYPVHAQYVAVDAVEIASLSDNVFKGQIVDITKDSVPVTDSEEDVKIPNMNRIIYTVKVSENIKGEQNTIDVVTVIPSKIGYDVGDKVLVMTSSLNGKNMLIGGPHSIFKLNEGKAIGDELTFDERELSDIIQNIPDRSSELGKSKGS